MALDERSRRQLEELGRRLPQPLPTPEPLQAAIEPMAPTGRHRVETETDPELLFRELMQASPDGSVPPHLLDRLRQLEQRRPGNSPGRKQPPAPPEGSNGGVTRNRRAPRRTGDSQDPRYVEFEQMLLEDDD